MGTGRLDGSGQLVMGMDGHEHGALAQGAPVPFIFVFYLY
jgi:hypothetical protein